MWMPFSKEEEQAAKEVEIAHDRAAGIVAGAFVETRLRGALMRRLTGPGGDSSRESVNEIFRASGPLGPFSVKIRMGLLMNLYSEQAYKDLDNFKEIRNRFAHHLTISSFDDQSIKARCENFTVVKSRCRLPEPGSHYTSGVTMNEDGSFYLVMHKLPESAREKYLASAQIFSFLFADMYMMEGFKQPWI
jgi:DNA-binding MltR family transcriptional regulator